LVGGEKSVMGRNGGVKSPSSLPFSSFSSFSSLPPL
jgi:hypothetical protein